MYVAYLFGDLLSDRSMQDEILPVGREVFLWMANKNQQYEPADQADVVNMAYARFAAVVATQRFPSEEVVAAGARLYSEALGCPVIVGAKNVGWLEVRVSVLYALYVADSLKVTKRGLDQVSGQKNQCLNLLQLNLILGVTKQMTQPCSDG